MTACYLVVADLLTLSTMAVAYAHGSRHPNHTFTSRSPLSPSSIPLPPISTLRVPSTFSHPMDSNLDNDCSISPRSQFPPHPSFLSQPYEYPNGSQIQTFPTSESQPGSSIRMLDGRSSASQIHPDLPPSGMQPFPVEQPEPTDYSPDETASEAEQVQSPVTFCICQPDPKIPRPRNGMLILFIPRLRQQLASSEESLHSNPKD